MKYLFFLTTILLLSNTCNTNKKTVEAKMLDQKTLSGSYLIRQLGEEKISSSKMKITFDGNSDKVTGFGGCNKFFGTYSLKNDTITFNGVASTKKYCGKEIGTNESNLLKILNKSLRITIKDNALILLEEDNPLLRADKINIPTEKKKSSSTNKTTIIYKALSRGSFEFIKITESQVSISADRNLKEFSFYPCADKDRNDLESLIQAIDLESIKTLKAPTDKRHYDGAAIATLNIITDKVNVTTESFDHGFPPKEIEALVNKVLSIKENVTKQ